MFLYNKLGGKMNNYLVSEVQNIHKYNMLQSQCNSTCREQLQSAKELHKRIQNFMTNLVTNSGVDICQKAELVSLLFGNDELCDLREKYWDFEIKTSYVRYIAWFLNQKLDNVCKRALKRLCIFVIPDFMELINDIEFSYLVEQKSILSCVLLEEYKLADELCIDKKIKKTLSLYNEKERNCTIYINDIIIDGNKIYFDYAVEGFIQRFFNGDKLFLEYENIKEIEKNRGILTATLLGSGMWLVALIFHADIYVDEVDKDFYESLERITEGLRNTYPNLDLYCNIKCKKVKNSGIDGTVLFFSGGVDSTYSLSKYAEKKPILVTLKGADMCIDSCNVNVIIEDTKRVAEKSGNLNYISVSSNLRRAYNEGLLGEELHKKGVPSDLWWWDGFNHGMGTISSIFPLIRQIGNEIIFSSTYSRQDGQVQWGGQPHLDGKMEVADSKVQYCGYELSRVQKIEYLVRNRKDKEKTYKLRVCGSQTGENCCECENCLMAMLTLYALGEDINMWGFHNLQFFEEIINSKRVVPISSRKKVFWEELLNMGNSFFENSRIEENEFKF